MIETLQIEDLLRQFYEISGFRVSIHDVEYHEIYAYPKIKCMYCAALQEKDEVLEQCLKSDKSALAKASQSGKNYAYICPNHLYEVVQPIYNYGVLSGYLVMGQVAADYPGKRQQLLQHATNVLQNRLQATLLVEDLTFIAPEKLQSYVGIMSVLAAHITENHMLCNRNVAMPIMVKQFLDANYNTKITIDRLSQKFDCSRSTVQKGFYNRYGCSVMQYLQDVRITKAKEMLKSTRQNIGQIAGACGYDDQNYFSRIFTKAVGCSPKAYREDTAK